MTGKSVDKSSLILFYTPEAQVVPHFAAQCILARSLKDQGYNVKFAFCPGIFARCPVMDMFLLPADVPPEQKKKICQGCGQHSQGILGMYGLDSVSLGDHLTAQAVVEVMELSQRFPPDLRDFSYDGIEFGKITLHDLVLAAKVTNYDAVSAENRVRWEQYASAAVLSYMVATQLYRTLNVGALVTYQDYGILLGARLAAERHGIPAYTTHAAWHRSVDRRNMVIVPEIEFRSVYQAGQRWPEWRDLALGRDDVIEVADDLLTKFGAVAGHVYSPPKTYDAQDLRAKLNLSADKKLVVAYTSSLDEFAAGSVVKNVFGIPFGDKQQPFRDQIDWLQNLITHFEGRDDAQLVIRVHPREGANKRESAVSEHLQQLRAHFSGSYRNCVVVWPQEKVSSYDLGELASLVLTSWSSMGLEMARLGVPVLSAFKGYFVWPHETFHEWAPTATDYFRKLGELLREPPGFEGLKLAFRWYHQFALGRAVDLGDVYPSADFEGAPPFKTPKAAAAIKEIIVDGRNVIDLNLERRRRAQFEHAAALEELVLKQQLRRIVHFLFTGADPPGDFTLQFVQRTGSVAAALAELGRSERGPGVHVFVSTPEGSAYSFDGQTIRRVSPMAARLAQAAAAQVTDDVDATLTQGQSLAARGSSDLVRTMYQQHLATRAWDPRVVDALMALTHDR
ncbi:MAG TPA: hypothetical protein VFH73_05870 [Polyangia bacterium]|jgi:hypothetical protein|nr:hypothetical protein [Polyangia bacterium]